MAWRQSGHTARTGASSLSATSPSMYRPLHARRQTSQVVSLFSSKRQTGPAIAVVPRASQRPRGPRGAPAVVLSYRLHRTPVVSRLRTGCRRRPRAVLVFRPTPGIGDVGFDHAPGIEDAHREQRNGARGGDDGALEFRGFFIIWIRSCVDREVPQFAWRGNRLIIPACGEG